MLSRQKSIKSLLFFVMIAVLMILPMGVRPVFAHAAADIVPAIWYVSTTGDDANSCTAVDGPCATINGALAKAAAGDTVDVAIGTYTGSGTEVVLINKNITLSGGWDEDFTSQTGLSTIDGEGARRGVSVSSYLTVALDHWQIQNGHVATDGGGIRTTSTFSLSNSVISHNTSEGFGGGIYSSGLLTIDSSTISDNTAGHSISYNPYGGGGGLHTNGNATLNNVTITENHVVSYFQGSGIYVQGDAVLNGSTVNDNTGDSAIRAGYLTLNDTTVSGNSDGGVYGYVGTISIKNSTITENANTAGYGLSSYAGTVTLANSILAGNSRSGSPVDCSVYMISAGYNLIGAKTSGCVFTPAAGDKIGTLTTPIDPRLTSLRDNGGPTLTHALMSGSPALNAGNPASPGSGGNACLATDQRGVVRPVDSTCDIGAFEGHIALVQSITPADPSPTSALSANFTVTFTEPVTGVDVSDFQLTSSTITGASITDVTGSGAAYNVAINTGAGNGTLRLDLIDDDSILDAAGGPLGGPGLGNGDYTTGETYTIRGPSVASITRIDASLTSATSLHFAVLFSEAVSGVDTTDFVLTTTGVSSPSVFDVTGSGTTYTVTVNTGTGNGTIRLDVVDDNSVVDANDRPLGGLDAGDGTFTTGEAYTIQGPYVTSITRLDASPVEAPSVRFLVTFSEPVTGVDTSAPFSDFTLTTTQLPGASVSAVTGSGATYTVIVTTGIDSGTVRLDVVDDNSIVDANGRPLGDVAVGDGSFTGGETYTILGPHVVSITRTSPNPTNAATVNFKVTFSEPVTGVKKVAPFTDFALSKTNLTGSAVTAVTGTGAIYTVTVKTGTGVLDDTLRLDVVDSNTIIGRNRVPLGGSGLGDGNFTRGQIYTLPKIPATRLPSATTWDTTPAYAWGKIPLATQYRYQLVKGTATIYTNTVSSTACTTGCSSTPSKLLVPGVYKWRVQAFVGGAWKSYSPYRSFTLYAPKAGHWMGAGTDFYVTPSRVQVSQFAIYISVSGCGNYKIWRTSPVNINNTGSFSFSGPFYANGSFGTASTSPAGASGSAGLNKFYIAGCGYVTGGPYSWSASWRSISQASVLSIPEFEPAIVASVLEGSLASLNMDAVSVQRMELEPKEIGSGIRR